MLEEAVDGVAAPKPTPAITIRCFENRLHIKPRAAASTSEITMTTDYFLDRKQSGLSDVVESPISPSTTQARSNPLTTKVTSVLSASYADSDIRDALSLLDSRSVQNSSETRRQLRLDVQKEVIESNGDIIREFGHVAEVWFFQSRCQITDSSFSNLNASGSQLQA